ncbi:hypothetical protein [Psychroserpens algicola]|uniref:Uncharacterized protein n=1 Tax=Psychroserpens algicola TaxID=1719034 RepID=A0ABT0HD60_9FLAO|nr:hypothetical protein [Psychroserpens algicola]MCK8482316.1 hypothetical protein [Psychroserpens algicola]
MNKKGITPIREDYKRNYPLGLPYLVFDENKSFNGIRGDFYNMKHYKLSDINIMPGYWKNSGDIENVLVVLIAMSNTTTSSLNKLKVTVESSNFGTFFKGELPMTELNKRQQRIKFLNKIELQKDSDIIKKVVGDTITVNIGGQLYKFLNPEIEVSK